MKRHMLHHGREKKHISAQCSKSSFQAANLKAHLLTHNGEKHHRCTRCNFSINHVVTLRNHITTQGEEKQHSCSQCNKSFSQPRHLKTRLLTHSGEKKHRCTQYNYSFKLVIFDATLCCTLEKSLTNAISVTILQLYWIIWRGMKWLTPGGKPQRCTVCKFSSITTDHLRIHMRTAHILRSNQTWSSTIAWFYVKAYEFTEYNPPPPNLRFHSFWVE